MKISLKPLASFLIVGSALTSLLGCSNITTNAQTPEPSSSPSTVSKCIEQGKGNWVTVLEKGNTISKTPLFIWQTVEFGDEYTPENRCKMVSEKLTKVVAENGGYLSGVLLKHGRVNNETVICATKQGECNEDNMLLTLRKEDAYIPQKVLKQIMDFSQNETDESLWQSGDPTRIEINTFLKLEDNW